MNINRKYVFTRGRKKKSLRDKEIQREKEEDEKVEKEKQIISSRILHF